MNLYFVCYADQDGNNHDAFVSAPTPIEAFVAWRMDAYGELWPGVGDDEVQVFPVPPMAGEAQVHEWDNAGTEVYPLNLDLLASEP